MKNRWTGIVFVFSVGVTQAEPKQPQLYVNPSSAIQSQSFCWYQGKAFSLGAHLEMQKRDFQCEYDARNRQTLRWIRLDENGQPLIKPSPKVSIHYQ